MDDGEIVDLLFGGLPHLHHFRLRSPTTPSSVILSSPPAQVIIDSELSRHVDKWSPTYCSAHWHDGYTRLQSALLADPTRYPHSIILDHFINGPGCKSDIPALESVYSIMQQVLFSPYFFPLLADRGMVPDREPIIMHAHANDSMEIAYMYHDSITTAGSVPYSSRVFEDYRG